MKLVKIMFLMIVAIAMLVGCGGEPAKQTGPKEVYMPDWYDIQDNPDYVYSYGQATKMTNNLSMDAAKANANLEAAQYVESQVKGMIKNFEQQSGMGENAELTALTSKVVKVVSNAKFNGTVVSKRKTIILENGKYQSFVRLSIPKDAVNKMAVNAIKKEEALYNEFKASQAFKELENDLN